MTELITLERFAEYAAAYMYSTNVNPRDGDGTCLYNGPDGSHCLVGQILADFGIEVPFSMEGTSADNVLSEEDVRDRFLPADFTHTVGLATALQEVADYRDTDDVEGRTWAEVIQRVRTSGHIYSRTERARGALVDACAAVR